MQYTANYELAMPEANDIADINVINENMNTIDQIMAQMVDLIRPVGSFYISAEPTDPGTLFGGTWQRIKDKFILAAGDEYEVGSTGGSADAVNVAHVHDISGTAVSAGTHTHTVSGSAASAGAHTHTATTSSAGAHTHTATTASAGAHTHTATTSSAGAHYHGIGNNANSFMSMTPRGKGLGQANMAKATNGWRNIYAPDCNYSGIDFQEKYYTDSTGAHTHTLTTSSAGAHTHTLTTSSAGAHTHTLTTSSAGAHTHNVSGNAASAGDHTHTVSGTAASSGVDGRGKNMPPYLATYIWQRIA